MAPNDLDFSDIDLGLEPAPEASDTRTRIQLSGWWRTSPVSSRSLLPGVGRAVVYDLETTGVDVGTARIVQIGAIVIDADGSEVFRGSVLVNPGILIPPEASAVHGITDEMVAGAPTIAELRDDLFRLFVAEQENYVLVGYNIDGYDNFILESELQRAGITDDWDWRGMKRIDVMRAWHRIEPRTLTAAAHRFGVPLTNAHSALDDAEATRGVLSAMLNTASFIRDNERVAVGAEVESVVLECESPVDPDGWLRIKDGTIIWSKGKHKGESFLSADPSYVSWICTKADGTSAMTKMIFADLLREARSRR